jgi:apoptosis-inducing factor 2
LGDDIINEEQRVKVTPTLQLIGHPRIFAAGDIIDYKEQKLAFMAYDHAKVVAPNVLSLLEDKKPAKEYTGAFEGVVLSIGHVSRPFGRIWWSVLTHSCYREVYRIWAFLEG